MSPSDTAPAGRRALRLAAIAGEQRRLQTDQAADDAGGWDEASQFNLDARNDDWSRLEGERLATIAA